MKETGIIMSGNHPRLILDRLKTQTRRGIKPQPERGVIYKCPGDDKSFSNFVMYLDARKTGWIPLGKTIFCPHGQAGDLLWVRETYYPCVDVEQKIRGDYVYKASEYAHLVVKGEWKSPRFMPRWASRITLEITEVKAERVQDISEEDAKAEGASYLYVVKNPQLLYPKVEGYRRGYLFTWDSLNAKPKPVIKNGVITHYESYPWGEESRDTRGIINGKPHYCCPNPWVFALSFRLLD